jgi:uncharacterized protein YqeY
MPLQDRLSDDLKEAMRQRDEIRRSTLRMLLSAIHNEEIDQGKPLNDEKITTVITRQIRQHLESIEAFRQGNRPELAEREETELAILRSYQPKQLSSAEILLLAERAIQETGAKGPGDLGGVMGRIMPQVRGKAEGSAVREIITKLLTK